MTLKEKFKQWLDTEPRLQIREVQLEVIAEEFAIEFAEWAIAKNMGVNKFTLYEGELKQFKKEKGL